jgi:hypothetical protein
MRRLILFASLAIILVSAIIANSTRFTDITGLAAIQSGGSMKLAAYGLMLKDPVSGNPTMYAHRVLLLQ